MGFREKEAAETNRSRINGSFNWLLMLDTGCSWVGLDGLGDFGFGRGESLILYGVKGGCNKSVDNFVRRRRGRNFLTGIAVLGSARVENIML